MVYLVPAAQGRFELYSEAPDGDPAEDPAIGPDGRPPGRFRRTVAASSRRWHEWVERARHDGQRGWLVAWRDRFIRALAESIAEQRTLWALHGRAAVCAHFPASLDAAGAQTVVRGVLGHARRHHGRWLIVDLVLFVCSGVLVPIPGPNIAAFYFAFRLVGHWQSWRGAKQGLDVTQWRYEPDTNLAELLGLVDVPRAARAARVEAIAERLNLAKLAAFFDRVAVPSA